MVLDPQSGRIMSSSSEDYVDNCVTFSSEGRLFQSAAPESSDGEPEVSYDLLTFLGIAQALKIDFLPASWDTDLAEGGSAEISQYSIDRTKSFAFKRLRFSHPSSSVEKEKAYKALIAEVCILGHEYIRDHSFVNKLQGISWDIASESESVWPVLVFEKTKHGDLESFMNSDNGAKTALEDRLRFCAEIAGAITDLHLNGKTQPVYQ